MKSTERQITMSSFLGCCWWEPDLTLMKMIEHEDSTGEEVEGVHGDERHLAVLR